MRPQEDFPSKSQEASSQMGTVISRIIKWEVNIVEIKNKKSSTRFFRLNKKTNSAGNDDHHSESLCIYSVIFNWLGTLYNCKIQLKPQAALRGVQALALSHPLWSDF